MTTLEQINGMARHFREMTGRVPSLYMTPSALNSLCDEVGGEWTMNVSFDAPDTFTYRRGGTAYRGILMPDHVMNGSIYIHDAYTTPAFMYERVLPKDEYDNLFWRVTEPEADDIGSMDSIL